MEITKTDLPGCVSYPEGAAKLHEALPMQPMKSRACMIRRLVGKLTAGPGRTNYQRNRNG